MPSAWRSKISAKHSGTATDRSIMAASLGAAGPARSVRHGSFMWARNAVGESSSAGSSFARSLSIPCGRATRALNGEWSTLYLAAEPGEFRENARYHGTTAPGLTALKYAPRTFLG